MRRRLRGKGGQHRVAEEIEDLMVAVEPGDRYGAEAVQHVPFIGMGVQVGLVRSRLTHPKHAHAPVDALAHLTPDFPEAPPTKSEVRQRPLKETDAIDVFHAQSALTERSTIRLKRER